MSAANDRNQPIIEEFRANKGKVGGFFENIDLLLLHTTGTKSGQPRVNPVAYIPDGEKYIVIASKGGAPSHPAWYHNLVGHPDIRVEIGIEEFQAIAEVAEEPERSELFGKMAGKYPQFGEYQRKTDRVIPVIILTRAS